jgi:hypothetical protein
VIEVFPGLFVGSQEDEAEVRREDGWFIISAAKEPYHRKALGYSGRSASKDHKEYLIARRGDRLILNLVDVSDPTLISPTIMDAAIDEIALHDRVLVHCNQGGSRGPTIALLYLKRHTDLFAGKTYAEGVKAFEKLYPPYDPAAGMASYARSHWND